ncbi:MAG: phosphoribosylglycinamide formyltransferase [Lysobacteraceae bacterium]
MPTPAKTRIAVLASGRGSNFAAIISAIGAGQINGEVIGLLSDKPESGAAGIAHDNGISLWSQRPKDFANRDAFDESLFTELDRIQPELILCAGYMRIIGDRFVERWTGRMINLHPSLLPAYPGLHTHARALADGVRVHGASVHFVTPELDGGPVIAQARIDVRDGDTPESLAERLRPREHALLCTVTAAICAGDIGWSNGSVAVRGRAASTPLQLEGVDRLVEQAA